MTRLSLKSTNPIPAFNSFFDVFVELDPASLGLDTGTMTINRTGIDGGTFDASIDVVSRITLTEAHNAFNTQVIGFTDQFHDQQCTLVLHPFAQQRGFRRRHDVGHVYRRHRGEWRSGDKFHLLRDANAVSVDFAAGDIAGAGNAGLDRGGVWAMGWGGNTAIGARFPL